MKMLTLLIAYLWLYKHLDSLPKLYYFCCNKRDVHVSEFRTFERTCAKVTKLRLDIIYFERCMDLKIVPRFLLFKLPKLKAYHKTDNLRSEILKNQISVLKSDLRRVIAKYEKFKERLKGRLSVLEYAALISKLNEKCRLDISNIQQRHQRKLSNLWKSQRTPAPDCLVNISDRHLSIEEENALRLGLKHHILPKCVNEIQIKSQVEQLYNTSKDAIVSGTGIIDPEFKDEVRHSTLSFLHSAKNVCGTRYNQNFHRTLKTLRSDPMIKVCSFDKGNGIVILNTTDYHKKLDNIILDKSKFKEIPVNVGMNHPVIRNENSIKGFLREKVKPFVSVRIFNSIYPSGSQPGKVYGLCKAHKPDMPLRPVVSMINTAEYGLAKYLDSLIKPHIPSTVMLDSTTGFLNRLKDFHFTPSDILVSFDVVSLFTNVPLHDTIHLIADHIYNLESKPPFDKATFIRMLQIATGGLFMHQGNLYKQVDGVTMGSPLGPTLANFCLAHYESQLLNDHAPALYLRYVDDIFCVFKPDTSHQDFLEKLNNLHPSLKFTAEIGPSTLPFLDTSISIPSTEDGMFTSQVYRKPTFTGLLLNFAALCPLKWKFGLIYCLLHRAYNISSNWSVFTKEVSFLEKIFVNNAYPSQFFATCVNRFLTKKFDPQSDRTQPLVERMETIFVVPYIGQASVIFGNKLCKLFKTRFLIDIKIVYTTFKIKNYFSLKCRTPLPLLANVVYRFQCSRDVNLTYIGKTKRHLTTRVREHGTSSTSAIKQHIDTCTPCRENYSINSFKTLDNASNDLQCIIKEALYIKHNNPTLNTQLSNQGQSYYLQLF